MIARKKDGNHHIVVKQFEELGYYVEDMTSRNNFCDIHISKNLVWCWVEIKNGNKKLTDGEKLFRESCATHGQPYYIVRDLDDILLLDRLLKI